MTKTTGAPSCAVISRANSGIRCLSLRSGDAIDGAFHARTSLANWTESNAKRAAATDFPHRLIGEWNSTRTSSVAGETITCRRDDRFQSNCLRCRNSCERIRELGDWVEGHFSSTLAARLRFSCSSLHETQGKVVLRICWIRHQDLPYHRWNVVEAGIGLSSKVPVALAAEIRNHGPLRLRLGRHHCLLPNQQDADIRIFGRVGERPQNREEPDPQTMKS